ncbi:MAG: SprT-like domain-containing protein, partial [Firmicutes bacterium]|nr:SprT-like domain-containing protein [Bacillota bacterium]
KFFENALSKIVITIQADMKQRALGWFTPYEAWSGAGDTTSPEINISANYLDRPPHEIISTMLHEMCHQYAYQHDIQDCSRNNTYHNKRFKEIAERHGLEVTKSVKGGYNVTALTAEAREIVEPIVSLLNLKRVVPTKLGKKTSSTRKYMCPECEMTVRATKEVNIKCGDCDEVMSEV